MGEILESISAKMSVLSIILLKMLNFFCVRLFTFQDEILKKLLLVRGASSSPKVPIFYNFLFQFCGKTFRGGGGGDIVWEGPSVHRGLCGAISKRDVQSHF